MTSLLLLKAINVLANFLILSHTLLFKYFSLWEENWWNLDFANKIQQIDVIMTSRYVIVSVKICLNVRNNDYFTLFNFGDHIMNVIEIIEGGL